MLIWQSTLLIIEYYQYEVNVQIELEFQQRPFPVVTICNLNPYSRSKAMKLPKVSVRLNRIPHFLFNKMLQIKRLMDTYVYVLQKTACTMNATSNANCNFVPDEEMDQNVLMYNFTVT